MNDPNWNQTKDGAIFSAFPIAMGFYTLPVDNYKILNYMENLDYNKSMGSATPDADIHISKNTKVLKDLPELERIFAEKVNFYIKEVYEWMIDIQFTKSWVTKAYPGGYSQPHYHANSLLSGIYYPFGNEGFKIMFKSPSPVISFWDMSDINFPSSSIYSAKEITFDTSDNLLIIFPSYLRHRVMPNNSKETRYSLAFNIFPKGKISNDDTEITIGEVY